MNTRKLLVVEDDATTRKFIQAALNHEGFEVFTASDGTEALDFLRQNGLPHLVLVDLGLPGMDGFTLCEQIKRMGDVPIIILTGNDRDDVKMYGLQQFADDYILKPFKAKEVALRIQRVLSRITDYSYADGLIVQVDKHLSIDFAHGRAFLDSKEIPLTRIEANLLHILMRNEGQVVSPQTLLARVWPSEEVFEDTLRVHMHRLRRKLQADAAGPQYIRTERGTGYMFRFPDDREKPLAQI